MSEVFPVWTLAANDLAQVAAVLTLPSVLIVGRSDDDEDEDEDDDEQDKDEDQTEEDEDGDGYSE